MNRFRTLLTLFVVSICAVQSAWARVAPALPEAQTLTSGQEYYLYNVMEGKFLCQSSTDWYYAGLGTYGDKVTINATDAENEYYIVWANNNRHITAYDTYVSSSESGYYWDDCFIFAQSSKGYTFQRTPRNSNYYKADEFIGFDGSHGDRLSPALTEGSIYWQLFSAEDAEYYMAKHKLFTYLEVADQYNFYITQYEQVYENPESTTAELDFAQATLKNALDMSQNYVSPSWTEYPILFQNNSNNKWELYDSNKSLYWYIYKDSGSALETTSTLKATVNVDADATLCYTFRGDWNATLRVYLDGEMVQNIYSSQIENERRYYIELTPGKHDIQWTCLYNNANTDYAYAYYYLSGIGVMNTPTITPATTTVEGQLGTEVLKLVDPVSSVKKIVITGVIGADDWTTIGLMKNAFSIDMSGATATAPIPARMFQEWSFLHDVKLPQGLTAIGESAFYETDVENEMTFPATLESIGNSAFYNTKLKAAYIPEGVKTMGNDIFEYCRYLENVTFPSSVGTIPNYCFYQCNNLRSFVIPEGINTIGESAFSGCWQFNPRFPSTLKEIKYNAFRDTAIDSVFVTEDMTVRYYAFEACRNLVYAEYPTSFYNISSNTNEVFLNCPKLNKLVLKSPTVLTYNSQDFVSGSSLGNITLEVPDFLVSTYKLDPYWYQFNVQGFNTADIKDWRIKQALVLNPGQRIGGTPNMYFSGQNASLTVNGDDVQTIDNMSINYGPIYYSWSGYDAAGEYVYGSQSQQWGMMLGNTDKVNITGELCEYLLSDAKQWYFMTLPFDTKVGDIVCKANDTKAATSFAIRYYDGANRASVGTGSNWKNYSADDIIPAGTGFIIQTAKAAHTKFVAQENASKQYILSNKEFVKALEANPSEVMANKGWNLVGNPWQTYYNIHKLNFTAPITVWNMDNRRYDAYSIIDDDYAIKPLEAIFVQCPDEVSSISFPIDGRQLTDVIESQSGAREFGAAAVSERQLIDIELTNGEMSDKTRLVLNPQAKMDYETSCDASKFFSMDGNVPQIYTLQNGVQMAINERPEGDGVVRIGMMIPAAGTYTVKSERNELTDAVLVDLQSGAQTSLVSDSYTFSAEAGTTENRFELRLTGGATGISTVASSQEPAGGKQFYNLNGQRVGAPQKGVYVVNGKKTIVK